MKTMWKKAIGIICAGGLSVMCLAVCGKDAAGSPETPTQEIQQNNVVDGEFYDGANLQGSVVEFSETGFSLSPATTETAADGGQVMAQAAPGSESDENNVQVTYTDNTVFQIVNLSASSQSEVSRENTDKESVKKQSSVCVFGTCQDTYHWTADKVLILRWQ
jgi:hypothetical protein